MMIRRPVLLVAVTSVFFFPGILPSKYLHAETATCSVVNVRSVPEAISSCTAVIESADISQLDRARAYLIRGRLYEYGPHDSDRAVADFNEAIRLQPAFSEAFHERANFYYTLKMYEKALADIETEMRLAPTDLHALFMHGMTNMALSRFKGAITDFDKISETPSFPNYPLALTKRGLAHSELGETALAMEDFNTTIRVYPKFAYAYFERAHLYEKIGDNRRALEDYNSAVETNNVATIYLRGRADLKSRMGDEVGALADRTHASEMEKSGMIPLLNP